jgi:hypothetical protein
MDHSGTSGMFMSGTIRIVKDGEPLSGADVVLFDQVRTTNENGVAEFEHVMAGPVTARIISGGKEYIQDFTITSADTSINIAGTGELYQKTNTVAPEFGHGSMMGNLQTAASSKNAFTWLIAGVIGTLLIIVILFKIILPRLFQSLSSHPNTKKNILLGGSLVVIVLLVGWFIFQSRITTNRSQSSTFTTSTRASTNNSLRVPQNLKSYPDDRVAIITWDTEAQPRTRGEMLREDKSRGIYGYYIEWAKQSLGFSAANKIITEYRWAQLQPLENGVPYVARVFAIDEAGNVSTESQTITFIGTSARVDAQRQAMNGFFDDFNKPQGAFDELLWNNSYSGCVGEGLGGQFINSQFHAHNEAAATNCDRGMSISRPRKKLDFKNRTATITFDLDGSAGSRTKWYLDVLGVASDVTADKPIDITSRIADNTGDIAHPGNILRIRQQDNVLEALIVDQSGEAYLLPLQDSCETFNNVSAELNYCRSQENNVPLDTTPNFRRKWKVQLSKTQLTIYIDNGLVYKASLVTGRTPNGLPYDQAYLHWLMFTYNTPKENRPIELFHWDNFGFDAPANDPQLGIETHNYTDGLVGTKVVDGQSIPHTEAFSNPPQLLNVKVPIPDSIKDKNGNNPVAARLMFTMQGYNNHSFEWKAGDNVTVNGATNKYLIPYPTTSTATNQLVETYKPYSTVLAIDPAVLTTGDNNLVFSVQRVGIFNVHIELDYPKNAAPTYTQPSGIFPGYDQLVIPKIADIGPAAYIDSINNVVTWDKIEHDADGNSISYIGSFAGTIDVNSNVYSNPSEIGNGKNYGIKSIELLVDRKVVIQKNTSSQVPIADYDGTLKFDTTQLCNGRHEIFLRGFNGNGSTSIPDYFQQSLYQGEYYPLFFNTNNPGKPACSGTYIPAATPQPYLTNPPAAPTGEHQPGPIQKSISLIMYQQNNSGQQGTVTFTENGPSSTKVYISIPALTFTNQPAHIHTGTCANPGPIVYSLTNVAAGQSETAVAVNYTQLFGKGYIVNVHKSESEMSSYTSCTQIVDPEATSPTPTLVPISPVPSITTIPTTNPSVTVVPSGGVTQGVSPSITVNPSITTAVTTVPSPTTASVTPNPSVTVSAACPRKPEGDANCDNKINLVDLEIWTREFLGDKSLNADFNGNNGVTLVDLQIWQTTYLSQ